MPGPPVAPDPGLLPDMAGAVGMLLGGTGNSPGSNSGSTSQEALAPGIRLAGIYTSSGGLKAQFADTSVVLDCGEAHVRDKYAVERAGSRILVHVQNASSPFTVEVQPNGSLAGPVSVTVAGRLVTGMNGNDIAFTPHSETCNLGTFTPGESASTATSVAAGPSAALPPRESPVAASAASAAVPSTAAPVRASFRVLIHAQLTEADLLAGQHVFVMRESLDSVLRKLGLPLPAGATPAQAMVKLAEACHTADCKPIYASLGQHFVASTALDAGGKATLSATAMTGPYYFFAVVHTTKGAFMWDVPVHVVAGDNTVALTAANAEVLGQ